MAKVIRARYEKDMLKYLEPIELKEGKEVGVRIEEDLRERLKDLISVLGESGGARKVLEEAWKP